jgi:NAD dependent epimerase/dehydratase family enzyme
MSWIASEDLIGVIHHLIHGEEISGPVNAVSPRPVTNRAFTKTLARVLGRPALLPLPAVAVRALFGEMGQALLLEGAKVLPAKLEASRFPFLYPDLESALRLETGRWPEKGPPAV